jgi:hypothetical protein
VSADRSDPVFEGVPMRSQRTTSTTGSRAENPATEKPRPQGTPPKGQAADRDSFLEIQAESGRRIRPLVVEHYGDTE